MYVCMYKGNGTEDEEMLWFEWLTTENMPHAPTALMALG